MKQETRVARRMSIITTLQEMLADADKKKDPDLKIILQKQIHRAKLGDLDSAKFILDRAFGTPTQMIESRNETELTINFKINEKE